MILFLMIICCCCCNDRWVHYFSDCGFCKAVSFIIPVVLAFSGFGVLIAQVVYLSDGSESHSSTNGMFWFFAPGCGILGTALLIGRLSRTDF